MTTTYQKRKQRWDRYVDASGRLVSRTGIHGKTTTYTNHGCRCERCCEAWRVRRLASRQERYALTKANGGIAPIPVHNLNTYRNWGCRCDVCREARRVQGN